PKNVRVTKPSDELALADTVYDFKTSDAAPERARQRDEASPESTRTRRRRIFAAIKKWGLRAAIASAALGVVGLVVGYLLVRHYEEGLPSVAELERGYRPSQVT